MGVTLAYERRGSGPPLVLLHPYGMRWQAWEPVLDLLAARRDVIAVDLPGFGASPPLARGMRYDFDNLSRVLESFFAELGLDRPDVAGNSLGGLLSIKLACRGSVRSATAIAPPTFSTALGTALMAAVIGPGIVALNLPGAVGLLTRSPRLRHAAGGLVVAHPRRQDPAAFLANLLALRGAPGAFPLLRHNVRGLRFRGSPPMVPVTIAWCERDRVVRHRYAVLASRILPSARQVMLPGCGHVPMSDNPRLVADLIQERSPVAE